MTLTQKDKSEMKAWGSVIRAFFVNPFGVPFHKDFADFEKMMEFVRKAEAVGSELRGFASI